MGSDVLSRIVKHIKYQRRRAKHPHLIDSYAWHPELVHSTASVKQASLSGRVTIGEHVLIEGPVGLCGDISVGNYTCINGPGTDVQSDIHPVVIGAFCSIARQVLIQEYNHPHNHCSTYYVISRLFDPSAQEAVSKGPIVIGSDVWIGTQCVILSGSRIGTGAIIGANSVVNSEIPPYAIAVGSPAKVIRYRFPKPIIERLLAVEWWNWPRARILRNRPLFEGELTLEKLDAIRD